MQHARQADVPAQLGLQPPEAEIDTDDADPENQAPLREGQELADQEPDQQQPGQVEKKVRQAQMHDMPGYEAPNLAVGYGRTLIAQPFTPVVAGQRECRRHQRYAHRQQPGSP